MPKTNETSAATAAQRAMLAASIPGRLRLRDARLGQPPICRALAERLRALEGVLSVDARPESRSVLLRYDAGCRTVAAMEVAVLAEVTQIFPDHRVAASYAAGKNHRRTLRGWNRAAKLGMIASLPVSLALAAAGTKKLHAVTGGIFALLLLVHLTTHRRHLLK